MPAPEVRSQASEINEERKGNGTKRIRGLSLMLPNIPSGQDGQRRQQQQQRGESRCAQQLRTARPDDHQISLSPEESLSSSRILSSTIDGSGDEEVEILGDSSTHLRPLVNPHLFRAPPPPAQPVSPNEPFDEDAFCEYLKANMGEPMNVRGGRVTCWDKIHNTDEEFLLAVIGACEGGINWKVAAYYFGHTKGATQKRFERFLQARKMWVADFWAMREKVTYIIDCFKRIGVPEPGTYACREFLDYFPNIPPVRTQPRDLACLGMPVTAHLGGADGDGEDRGMGRGRRGSNLGRRGGQGVNSEKHNKMVQMRLMQQHRQGVQAISQIAMSPGYFPRTIADEESPQHYVDRTDPNSISSHQYFRIHHGSSALQYSPSSPAAFARRQELAAILDNAAPTHTTAVVDAMPKGISTMQRNHQMGVYGFVPQYGGRGCGYAMHGGVLMSRAVMGSGRGSNGNGQNLTSKKRGPPEEFENRPEKKSQIPRGNSRVGSSETDSSALMTMTMAFQNQLGYQSFFDTQALDPTLATSNDVSLLPAFPSCDGNVPVDFSAYSGLDNLSVPLDKCLLKVTGVDSLTDQKPGQSVDSGVSGMEGGIGGIGGEDADGDSDRDLRELLGGCDGEDWLRIDMECEAEAHTEAGVV